MDVNMDLLSAILFELIDAESLEFWIDYAKSPEYDPAHGII